MSHGPYPTSYKPGLVFAGMSPHYGGMTDASITCGSCGKPAFSQVKGADGAPIGLCIDHHIQLMAVQNEQGRNQIDHQRHAMAMMKYADESMDAISGFSVGPKVSIPALAAANTYSALNVTNHGNIGVINTARVNQISAVIGSMPVDDKAREAIQSFTAAVADAQELSDNARQDLLEQVEAIATIAAAKPEERRRGIIGPILGGITKGAAAVEGLGHAWAAVEPIIKAHLSL
jgi:hypothetical protein